LDSGEVHLPPKVMERATMRLGGRDKIKYMEQAKMHEVAKKHRKRPPKSFVDLDRLFGPKQ
jgi:hypothetical protein